MKVLLFCLPRTRSTYFQDVLSKHYNLDNYKEPYTHIENKVINSTLIRKPDIIWNKYQQELLHVTSLLSERDNFVTKIFTANTYNALQNVYSKNDDIHFDENSMLDLEAYFKLSSYDKIFVLKRKNLIDHFCSYFFAKYHNKFLYEPHEGKIIQQNSEKSIFVHVHYKLLKSALVDVMLMDYQAALLKQKNINYELVNYEDIPNLVSIKFGNVQSDFLDANYDYQSMIKNYEEIVNGIEKAKKELLENPVILNLYNKSKLLS